MSAEPARTAVAGLSPFWVYTAAGLPFDFANPSPQMIERRALAWQLSGEGRWANNTQFALSVAQHSLLVAHAINRPEYRIYGLLHDAAEAFTRDLPTPFKLWLKSQGANVQALERRILLEAVLPYFELADPLPEIDRVVDYADARALATEYRDAVAGKGPEWVPSLPPLSTTVRFKRRETVLEEFLAALDTMQRDAWKAGFKRSASQ